MPRRTLLLGIDLSTTGAKALLIDEAGTVIASASTPLTLSTPHPLWAEQEPRDWWQATVASIRAALAMAAANGAEVRAVGLTGQMHGLALLDAQGEPLRPAILWNDQRTAAECDEIRARVGRSRLIAVTGNDALTGFTAPKVLWVRRHEPEIYARAAHILLPKDYIRYRLTDDFAMDKADGSGTLLFDLAARDWSPEVTAALDIPRVVAAANLRGARDHRGHQRRGCRAHGAGGGYTSDGGWRRSGGAGGGRRRYRAGHGGGDAGYIRRRLRRHSHAALRARGTAARLLPCRAGTLASDGRDALGGGQPPVAARHARARRQLRCADGRGRPGARRKRGTALSALSLRGAHAPSRSAGAWRVGGADAAAHASAYGARRAGGRRVRPARWLHIAGAGGSGRMARVRVSGGGARSPLWRTILASVLAIPLESVAASEGAAYGAALLAGVGAGVWPDVATACAATIQPGEMTTPNGDWQAEYERLYPIYQSLYPALKPAFAALADG